MNKTEQFITTFTEALDTMQQTMEAKNHDYASAGEDDPFFNFKQVENLGITSVERGFLVRMTDKMTRLSSLLDREAKVLDEKLEDTVLDMANYAVLLYTYLKTKEESK